MSKIICDVCGTSYQNSATQCPICGCARPVDIVPNVATDDEGFTHRENYTYIKGGRFSKANVQKRNKGILPKNHEKSTGFDLPVNSANNKSDKGLVIAVCALLLAIIAVVIYIAVHFFSDLDNTDYNQPDTQITTTQATQTTPSTVDLDVACTSMVLSQSEITLTYIGETLTLRAILTPVDTTDELMFSTSDEAVATVSASGDVVAVSDGQAIITASCGEVSAQCLVVCNLSTDTTDPATEPTTETGTYTAPYKINKTDVSISVGETFLLKLLDANGELIPVTWSPAVTDICSIDGNSVTGEIKGKVEISTAYEGETYTCIVRVR